MTDDVPKDVSENLAWLMHGCQSNICDVALHIGGVRVNCGCRCDERTLRRALRWWRKRALERREEAR